jgi:hypothetical protein
MIAPGQISEYHTSKPVVTVQRAFRAKYAKNPPTDKKFLRGINSLLKLGIDAPMLTRVWQELEYRIDVCRVTRGAHMGHL